MVTKPDFDEQTENVTGRTLNEKWDVGASQALYREDGELYHMLTQFPGVLFDQDGYVLFDTLNAFLSHPDINADPTTNQVHIPKGISNISGYVRVADIVKDDTDTYEGGDYQEAIKTTIDYGDIDLREDNQSIFEWNRRMDRNLIVTDPDFQRNLVWTQTQKSQFIESILLNFPLPPIYVNQNTEGKYILVDGLQRTTAMHEFVKSKFALTGLLKLQNLNGKSFKSLDPSEQTRIEDRKLFIFVIKPSASLGAIYEIFYRINRGGTQLNRQEIRNCLYVGEATRFLKSLAEGPEFLQATDKGFSPKRMKDREAVLRCIAFANFDYENDYRGDMDEFLGYVMKMINEGRNERARLDPIRVQFVEVMQWTYEVFSIHNFRPMTDETKSRGRINIALMESVYRYFAINKSKKTVKRDRERLLRNYSLLCNDAEFIDAIQRSTSGRRRVLIRLNKAMEILGGP
jgi:Protein of unknown function DUF262